MKTAARYFEDFHIGETLQSAEFHLSEKECIAFAHLYDPQPFHLSNEDAEASVFRELTASGWQTAAITMRLMVESGVFRATGIIGTGIDDLRWLAPVHPGDSLYVRAEIVEKTPWPGNKGRGTVRVRLHTINQHGVVVMSQIANLMVAARPNGAAQ